MKHSILYLLLSLVLLSACSKKKETSTQSVQTFTSMWDGFDFSDKSMINNPGVTESKFKEFCGSLSMSDAPTRQSQIDTLLARSERGSKEMFLGFMDLAEKYLQDPNSPLRNEESYIPFLEYAIHKAKIDETYKERYRYQLSNAQKNRFGTIANDFSYTTREGQVGTLKNTPGKYTLVYFNNPDCHDCKRVYNILTSSPSIAHLVAGGELTLLALYPDEDLSSWNKHKEEFPYSWIVARFSSQAEKEKYNLAAIPSLYLLDKKKKVVLKDAPIEEIEAYLRQKYNL